MSESATQHNHAATQKELHEAGFPSVVSKPLSQFTVMLHTRTLGPEIEQEFLEWAAEQDHITHWGEDGAGHIYRWNI